MIGVCVKCHLCGYVWKYGGKSDFRTTCPVCHKTVYLKGCTISDEEYRKGLISMIENELKRLRLEDEV